MRLRSRVLQILLALVWWVVPKIIQVPIEELTGWRIIVHSDSGKWIYDVLKWDSKFFRVQL